ncbi:notum, partial [Symbiodinium sp. KB8]
KPSSSSNSSTWIVDLEGGGWCDSKEDCFWHCVQTPLSALCTHYARMCPRALPRPAAIQGLLDDLLDPVLKDANKIFISYCTSDGHMGDGSSWNLQFRGARVVQAVFRDLMQRFHFASGDRRHLLVLGGQSAGARGAMVNLDYMPDILGPAAANVKVIGFLDSPFWLDMPPYAGSSFIGFNHSCKQVFDMANVTRLGSACAAQYPAEPWKCIMGQYRMPHLRTAYLMVASQYDSFQLEKNLGHKPPFDDAEKRYAEGFAQKTRALALSLRTQWPETGSQNAVFSWACYEHATSLSRAGFDEHACGQNSTTLDSATAQFLGLSPATGSPRVLSWVDTCTDFACGPGCKKTHGAPKKLQEPWIFA